MSDLAVYGYAVCAFVLALIVADRALRDPTVPPAGRPLAVALAVLVGLVWPLWVIVGVVLAIHRATRKESL